MIGGYPSQSYTGTVIADVILFLAAVPFGVCDLYYSFKDFSCVWTPIERYAIRFPLQTWLRVDGGVLLGMSALILLLGIIVSCNPLNGSGLFWFHNTLGFIFALFRLAWLIIGSIMFWGYLNKYHLCDNPVKIYMWVNLIAGFVHSFLYFCLPCLCGLAGKPGIGGTFGVNQGIGFGTGTALGMGSQYAMGGPSYGATPLPVTTPSIRQTVRETKYAIY